MTNPYAGALAIDVVCDIRGSPAFGKRPKMTTEMATLPGIHVAGYSECQSSLADVFGSDTGATVDLCTPGLFNQGAVNCASADLDSDGYISRSEALCAYTTLWDGYLIWDSNGGRGAPSWKRKQKEKAQARSPFADAGSVTFNGVKYPLVYQTVSGSSSGRPLGDVVGKTRPTVNCDPFDFGEGRNSTKDGFDARDLLRTSDKMFCFESVVKKMDTNFDNRLSVEECEANDELKMRKLPKCTQSCTSTVPCTTCECVSSAQLVTCARPRVKHSPRALL